MNAIAEIIKKVQYVTVEQFMEMSLSHPIHGYYRNHVTIGRDGDFVTAPCISSIFGEMITIYLANFIYLNDLKDVTLIECGPGDGQLMLDIINTLRKLRKGDALRRIKSVIMLEISPKLIDLQQKKLASMPVEIKWHSDIKDIAEDGNLIFLGNEFWDSIPIKQYVHFGGHWYERLVSADENGDLFFSCNTEVDYGSLSKGIDAVMKKNNNAADGEIVEIPRIGLNLMEQMSTMINKHGGMGLFIDYGYDMLPSSYNSTIQSVQNHKLVNPLINPGFSDITHLVNFALLSQTAQEGGLQYQVKTQGDFLRSCGIQERVSRLKESNKLGKSATDALLMSIDRLVSTKKMGDLFKVIACHSTDLHIA